MNNLAASAGVAASQTSKPVRARAAVGIADKDTPAPARVASGETLAAGAEIADKVGPAMEIPDGKVADKDHIRRGTLIEDIGANKTDAVACSFITGPHRGAVDGFRVDVHAHGPPIIPARVCLLCPATAQGGGAAEILPEDQRLAPVNRAKKGRDVAR